MANRSGVADDDPDLRVLRRVGRRMARADDVDAVAEAHEWSVRIEDGDRLGGARFVVEP